jgi:hypothetical protein
VLTAAMPTWADGDAPALLAEAGEAPGPYRVSDPAVDGEAGIYRLMDTQLEYPAAWRLAQAAPAPVSAANTSGKDPRRNKHQRVS